MNRTVLHIGAHKTASTYMQRKLALNAGLLADHGLHYEPLDVLRKSFTPLLNEKRGKANDFVQTLIQQRQKRRLLISEENILGVPGDLIKQGAYYAQAGERIATTIKLLDDDAPQIFLALREYSAFTVSMYSEYIRHRAFVRFDDYFEMYTASHFSWTKVIDALVAAVPKATFNLWDFGQFRAIEHDVFAAMLGIDPTLLRQPDGPVRESFSDTAIRAIEALSGVLSHQDLKKLIGPISRNLPRGEDHAPFDPMKPAATTALKQQYHADLVAIAAKHPAIRFIGPTPSGKT